MRTISQEIGALMGSAEPLILRMAWGWWDQRGYWHHNPMLSLTNEQQKAENEANGYVCKTESYSKTLE